MDLIFTKKITWKINGAIDNIIFFIHFNEDNNIKDILIDNKVKYNISTILNQDMEEEIELYKLNHERTIKRINKLIDELEPLLESISCGFDLNVLFNEQCNYPSKFYISVIEINSKKGDFFYKYYINKKFRLD